MAEGRKDVHGLPEIEREHELQIALVDAFERAAGANERIEAGKILEEMADLSEMHFLAEELVMRLHQYPAFEEHAAEHVRLIREMNELRAPERGRHARDHPGARRPPPAHAHEPSPRDRPRPRDVLESRGRRGEASGGVLGLTPPESDPLKT